MGPGGLDVHLVVHDGCGGGVSSAEALTVRWMGGCLEVEAGVRVAVVVRDGAAIKLAMKSE